MENLKKHPMSGILVFGQVGVNVSKLFFIQN